MRSGGAGWISYILGDAYRKRSISDFLKQKFTDGRPHSAIAVFKTRGNSCVCLQVPIMGVGSTRAHRLLSGQLPLVYQRWEGLYNNSWIPRGGIKMLAVGGRKRSTTDNMQIFSVCWSYGAVLFQYTRSYFLLWPGATVSPFSLRLLPSDENVKLITGSIMAAIGKWRPHKYYSSVEMQPWKGENSMAKINEIDCWTVCCCRWERRRQCRWEIAVIQHVIEAITCLFRI